MADFLCSFKPPSLKFTFLCSFKIFLVNLQFIKYFKYVSTINNKAARPVPHRRKVKNFETFWREHNAPTRLQQSVRDRLKSDIGQTATVSYYPWNDADPVRAAGVILPAQNKLERLENAPQNLSRSHPFGLV